MHSGYILFCGKAAFGQCLSRKIYTCAGEDAKNVKRIRKGSVLFTYNSDSDSLVGPFTAASEGATRIETGTWTSKMDPSSITGNIKLMWEDLHIIEKAKERFTFLNDPKKCDLSPIWTQTLLDALGEAPLFKGQ
ncbi:MAG: hypothetical protein ACE14S_10775 [Candidatus Bathyarchaeia archaeon]